MRSSLSLYLLLALSPLVAAAEKIDRSKPIPIVQLDRKSPVSYEKDVEPILVNKCQFCHSGPIKEGKLDLGSYEAMMKGGKNGKSVIPGKSAESLLVKLSAKVQKPLMPPKSEEPLTPEELAIVKLWIDQGAKPPSGVREKPKVALSLPPDLIHPVRSVVLTPDGNTLAASRGNQIHLYDAKTGNYLRALVDPALTTPDKKPLKAAHLPLVESLACSPDGKTIASGSYQEVICWDVVSGAPRGKLSGFVDRVVALAYSPDGKLLATGGGAPTEDGEIKVFETASNKQLLDVKNGHSDTVFGVCFSPDSTKLATCGADKFVKVFEMSGGKFLKSFEGHTHHVLDVGWKADGKLLASGGADNVIKIWDYEKGEQARTVTGHGKQITRLQFMTKQPLFVTSSGDNSVRTWNVDNGGNTKTFGGREDFLYTVTVSADGGVIAAGGELGVVRLYNGNTGAIIKELVPPGVELPTATAMTAPKLAKPGKKK